MEASETIYKFTFKIVMVWQICYMSKYVEKNDPICLILSDFDAAFAHIKV